MRPRLLCFAILLGAAAPVQAADPPPSGGVRIYRCVGSNGAVALQDAPCDQGHQQQVMDMQRPQDPPPRQASTQPVPAAAAAPAPVREVRVVTVAPPQPMYECVTSEGTRYTSDNDDGNPRWVPTWTVGYGYPRGGVRPGPPPNRPGPHPGPGPGPGPRPQPGVGVIVPYGSIQIRDECHALPQQEVCARLRDRRWELIRRYNSALQSERQALTREQRGIDARLDQDCGGA